MSVNLSDVDFDFFDRAPETLGQSDQRAALPIEEKESFRWLQGYRLACKAAPATPKTQVVSVADREADIYDIYIDAQQQVGPRADFIIRARADRSTLKRDVTVSKNAYYKVRDEVARAKVLTTQFVELSETPKRKARTAWLEIPVLTVAVKPSLDRPHLPSVTLNVVLATETGGPGDDADVSWLLITSLPIATSAEALLVLDYYVGRWAVEIFFRTLQHDCRLAKTYPLGPFALAVRSI